jgi:ATP-dependent protease ClpP protease subunit/regulator of replication initiation timing
VKGTNLKILAQAPVDGVAYIDVVGVIGDQYEEEYARFVLEKEKSLTLENLRSQLSKVKGAQKVVVNIDSEGGLIFEALAMYDELKRMDVEVETNAIGFTASAATIILQAASPGKRFISANVPILVHEVRYPGYFSDLTAEIARTIEADLETANDMAAKIYAENSYKSAEEMRAIMAERNGEGRYLTPEEAIELGFADAIMGETDKMEAKAAMVMRAKSQTTNTKPKLKMENPFKDFFARLNKGEVQTEETAQAVEALKEQVEALTTANADLTAKADKLEAIKAELETAKTDLETAQNELTEAKANADKLATAKADLEAKLSKGLDEKPDGSGEGKTSDENLLMKTNPEAYEYLKRSGLGSKLANA